MNSDDRDRAIVAVRSMAASLGLAVDDAVVLSDSNRLVLRLLPSDVVARVSTVGHFASAALEVELATRLAGSPIGPLDPRVAPQVFVDDDVEVTFWEHLEPVAARRIPPTEYAAALVSLHVGLRGVAVDAPHVGDRIAATLEFVTDHDLTPDLPGADRTLLISTMRDMVASIVAPDVPAQLLHGEPHPWNLIDTSRGVRFIDFENVCVGPLEYDLAWVPDEVATRYPDVDHALLADCRAVVLAIIAAHRWSRDDRHPSGRRSGHAFLDAVRAGPPWPTLDQITW